MNLRSAPPTRTRACRGFSLLESTITVLITGVALVAAMNTLAAGRVAAAKADQRETARWLAEELAAELAFVPVVPVAGHGGAPRAGHRVLDDYADFRDGPPADASGEPLLGARDAADLWSREVDVQAVARTPLGALAGSGPSSDSDAGLRRVTLTIRLHGRTAHVLTLYRSRAGLHPNAGRGLSL